MQDINYSGQYYNNKHYSIKARIGEDIANATGDAICGEFMIATGGAYPGLYIATETSNDNFAIYRVSETNIKNKVRVPVLIYEITSSGGDFNLRARYTVDSYDVDWGDGNSESSTADVLTHTYAAGSYTIKITPSGFYRPFYPNQTADLDQITSIEIDDGIDLGTSLAESFKGAGNMTNFTALKATSTVTNFYFAWRYCSGLTSFPVIDTSSGTSFQTAWAGCSGLTSFPLLDFSNAEGTLAFSTAWYVCPNLAHFPANMFDSTGAISSDAFNLAWHGCALTAQSIENILTSLDTNGASNITLGIDGGTNAVYSTWSTAAQTALSNLQNKGWTVSYNT